MASNPEFHNPEASSSNTEPFFVEFFDLHLDEEVVLKKVEIVSESGTEMAVEARKLEFMSGDDMRGTGLVDRKIITKEDYLSAKRFILSQIEQKEIPRYKFDRLTRISIELNNVGMILDNQNTPKNK